MNLVGKIFIVLIFVMALCWMMASVSVYATHQNWRDLVENDQNGLRKQVEDKKNDNQELQDKLDKETAELAAEKAARRQALAKLETEKAELERQRDEQDKRLAALVQSETDALAQLKATQEAEAALRAEVVGLKEEIRQAQADRDKHFDTAAKLTDQLHQAANEYLSLKNRMVTLTADLAKAVEVLRKHDLVPEPTVYSGIPPTVDGVVLEVGANGLIEVSIGSDDGLMKGHQLEIVRQGDGASVWLGRVEVTETSPDKAVCKVLPEFLQRPIQRDDRVTTKLK